MTRGLDNKARDYPPPRYSLTHGAILWLLNPRNLRPQACSSLLSTRPGN